MDFGSHVDGRAEEEGHLLVEQHGPAVVDELHVAEAVDHDVGGFDVGVHEPHLVEGFEAAQDLAENVERDAGLDHDPAVFPAEDDVGEPPPFFVGGTGADLLEVGAVQQFAQGNAVDDLHLDVADSVAFLVDFGDDEGGVLDELELGGLGGDAAHVGPVFLGVGIDGGVEELDGVSGDAAARALAEAEKHDALASAAEFAGKAVGDGVVDGAGGENGAVVGGELAAAGPGRRRGGRHELAQDGWIASRGGVQHGGGFGIGAGNDFQGGRLVEYRFVFHAREFT